MKFQSYENLTEEVTFLFDELVAKKYEVEIQKLCIHYEKCLNLHGDYVEKYFKISYHVVNK